MGDAAKDVALSKYVSGQVPIEIEALWRFTPEISAGLYFGYGFAFASKDICAAQGGLPAGVSCSTSGASVMRYGIQGQYRFLGVMQGATPWAGLGIGYETASVDVKGSYQGFSASYTAKVSGWEYLNLQGGVEWAVMPGLSVGPFARIGFAKYSTAEANGGSADIPSSDQTFHEWLTIGVKGTFDIAMK
jgi:hypothetical protein